MMPAVCDWWFGFRVRQLHDSVNSPSVLYGDWGERLGCPLAGSLAFFHVERCWVILTCVLRCVVM